MVDRFRKRAGMAIGLAMGIAAMAFGGPASAEPMKLRIAWTVAPAQLAPLMLAPPGVARHAGKSYTLEPIRIPGSGATLTAFGAGELDIAPLTFIQLGPAIQNAGMKDLKIIADEFRDGIEGYATNEYRVAKDGPVKTVADLKGRVFATNGIGGGNDVFGRVMMRRHGLEYRRDYTIIEAQFPNMRAMLLEGKADLVVAVPPFNLDPTFRENSRVLFTQREAVGPTDMVFFTVRGSFIEKHRGVLVDFLEDYVRAVRWYIDPANHEQAVKIVSDFTKFPPERLGWIFTKADFYRDPDARPDPEAIQRSVDLLREFNFLRAPLDISEHVDLGPLEEALKRID